MTNHLPDRRAYSDRAALLCAQLSALSYIDFDTAEGKAKLDGGLEAIDAEKIDTVSKQKSLPILKGKDLIDTQAICVDHIDSNIRVIAFRGTEPDDLTDWITDARIKLDDAGDGIELHTGFNKAYNIACLSG